MNQSHNSTTRISDTGDDRVDVIMFPSTLPNIDARSWTALRRRLRWLVDLGLIAVVIVLAIAVTRLASRPDPAAPVPAASKSGDSRPSHPRLIAPDTASAREQIIVLAYAYRNRCGPTELRFDDRPVTHRLNRYVGSPHPDWIEMFMTLDVPVRATHGRHDIQLFGASLAGPSSSRCDPNTTQLTLLATVTITLGP